MAGRKNKKEAAAEQYPMSEVLALRTTKKPLDLVAPETGDDENDPNRLSGKAAEGIAQWLQGVPWKDAAKYCGMSVSGLKTARFSTAGKDLIGAHYLAVTEWTKHKHTEALRTVANELENIDANVRLKAAEILLRHVNVGKDVSDGSKTKANASDIAKVLVDAINIQVNIVPDKPTEIKEIN